MRVADGSIRIQAAGQSNKLQASASISEKMQRKYTTRFTDLAYFCTHNYIQR